MRTISLLVADDHELVREGIKTRLERQPGWRVCAEAANGREAVALAARLKPDIAVLDIGMTELNGIEAAVQIRDRSPGTQILILTLQDADQQVRAALAAGARGFILKTDAARLLVEAVQSLLDHRPFFTGKIARKILDGYLQAGGSTTAASGLTSREREIVQLLAEAHTSKDVARRLGVSAKTIDAHRANLLRKLDLHSVAELVRYAIRNRIIEP